MDRQQYADIIVKKLEDSRQKLKSDFAEGGRIQSCIIDNLLPNDAAEEIATAFPAKEEMNLLKNIKELKYTAKQLDKYDSKIEEIVFAFQDPRVVQTVSDITGLEGLHPDPYLYAGGISLMANGNFLLPHIDNSHDKDRDQYRVLNLLYYISPKWKKEYGGNLELWDKGPDGEPREIVSAFNRLVIMATHETSWHSVNEVKVTQDRCCISNYYFSRKPIAAHEYFHVTTYRARPGQQILNMVLKADGVLRAGVRMVARKGIKRPEVFEKNK